MEQNKLRVAIVGCGGIAGAHMRSYQKMDDVDIVAGVDIVPGKARAFLDRFALTGVPDFEDEAKMIAELKPDAISVCTYNTTHAPCAIMAMEAGIDVLCEKPMSVTLGEAVDMARAQKKTGRILTIGFQPRYDDNMKMVRDLVQSGILGNLYYIQTGGGRRRGIPGRTFIQKQYAGVGALADIGCYGLDMALSAAGYRKPVTVSAMTGDLFGKNPKYYKESDLFSVDDFAVAFIRFEDGLTMDFRISWAMHMDTMGDTLFLGTDGGLKVASPDKEKMWGGAWDGTIGPVTYYHDVAGEPVATTIPLKPINEDRFYSKVRAFVDAVKTQGPSPIPWQQILYNQAILDGIIRSGEQRCEVKIEIPEI